MPVKLVVRNEPDILAVNFEMSSKPFQSRLVVIDSIGEIGIPAGDNQTRIRDVLLKKYLLEIVSAFEVIHLIQPITHLTKSVKQSRTELPDLSMSFCVFDVWLFVRSAARTTLFTASKPSCIAKRSSECTRVESDVLRFPARALQPVRSEAYESGRCFQPCRQHPPVGWSTAGSVS